MVAPPVPQDAAGDLLLACVRFRQSPSEHRAALRQAIEATAAHRLPTPWHRLRLFALQVVELPKPAPDLLDALGRFVAATEATPAHLLQRDPRRIAEAARFSDEVAARARHSDEVAARARQWQDRADMK